MILVQLPQDDGHIRIGHKLVYIVRTVKDRIYEIALAFLPCQNGVERIGKTQSILGCTVIKGNGNFTVWGSLKCQNFQFPLM